MSAATQILSPADLLAHWQGHRALTRRIIEAFPDDQFNTFSIGGMRTFGELALELLMMDEPMIAGVVTGEWKTFEWPGPRPTRIEMLAAWDEATASMNALWPRISDERFQETVVAFGQYEGKVINSFLYVIDNQVHHRGQGYVYLRALGVEPAPFYVRE
ncbi:MAG: DinB family protein [Gemmatimonadota bacterium]